MIIYEVNVNLDKEIYPEFTLWLKDHVKEMLQFQGFVQASILKQEQDEAFEQEKLTVQYQLEKREDLENYFIEFASKMREESIRRFKEKFSATRRVFYVQNLIQKNDE